jgi:hypothetical protein
LGKSITPTYEKTGFTRDDNIMAEAKYAPERRPNFLLIIMIGMVFNKNKKTSPINLLYP